MSDKQTDRLSGFLNIANWLFKNTLDPSDILSLYQAKKILNYSSFIYNNTTVYLSEKNAAAALFISINLATLVYQYIYATWFLYLITSCSGIKKLYRAIFQNPILGIFFYLSFYFKLLNETDREKFNLISGALGLPEHGKDFLNTFITQISNKLSGTDIKGYKMVLKKLLRKLVSEQIISPKVENIPTLFKNIIKEDIIKHIQNGAVYFDKNTIETEADLDEFIDFIKLNKTRIEKEVKRNIKNKALRKAELRKILEKRDSEGNTICLDTCKPRIKTRVGCICESDCGPTIFGRESWCYVDPQKCKRGKYLNKYFGKSYDKCDADKITQPKCFTGINYKNCTIKSG